VVIAAEPPVLFTHSVKSLTEWRYSNETYRQVVRSAKSSPTATSPPLKCEPGKHWFLIEAIGAPMNSLPPGLGGNLRVAKFAGVVKRRDHGRTPVHEQIAKMFGETIEYAQLEVFARGMPADLAKALGSSPVRPR
jgi:hypothetical protein